MKVKWNEEKTNIEKLIKEGVSYERIGRQYGVTGASVKKAAKKLGIELEQKRAISPSEHFNKGKRTIHKCLNCGKEFEHSNNSKNKFCSNKCQGEYRTNLVVKKWLEGNFNGLVGKYNLSTAIRNYLLNKHNYKCEKCGWGEINTHTNTIPLEIHHIDGDYKNNKEEKLQVLCPNCHSLTETYKSHNKQGRKDRKKYGNDILVGYKKI